MKEYIGERAKWCGLFIAQVVVSVTALVLLALAVGALSVREEAAPVTATEDASSLKTYIQMPEKWSELDPEERVWGLENIEKEVGFAGPIYIALGALESPNRSSTNETHLFDAYGLMFPGSHLLCVLLCPTVSSNPDDPPPPFLSPPLSNIEIRRGEVHPSGETLEPLKGRPAQVPTDTPNQRIPRFVYHNGVPFLELRALGKIPIKMFAVNRMIVQRELEQ